MLNSESSTEHGLFKKIWCKYEKYHKKFKVKIQVYFTKFCFLPGFWNDSKVL